MGKGVAFLLVLFFLTASCLIAPLPANAEPKTLVVPDDYPAISSAIGNATAGDTIFVKKGTYEGPINQTLAINKSISFIGEDTNNTILNLHPSYTEWWILTQPYTSSSDAIVINANDVRLLNLTLSFMGDIRANGDRVQIIGNNIASRSTETGLIISGSDCNITNNVILGRVNLEGGSNAIIQNNFYSLILQSANRNIIDSNTFQYLQLTSSSKNIVSKNNISNELVKYAITVRNSTNNLFHSNQVEVTSLWSINLRIESQAQNNTFYSNAFIGQGELVSIDTTAYGNFWDNGINGNFWSNYNGTDANRDGIGDTPYVINGANFDNYPLMFPYDIENDTVVLPPPEPFPTTLVIASVAAIAAVGAVLLVYFKKRKH
jgi:nitrous oxidase accessory protein